MILSISIKSWKVLTFRSGYMSWMRRWSPWKTMTYKILSYCQKMQNLLIAKIFKTKRDSKGNAERYHASCSKGLYTKCINYKETFSLVSSKYSIKIIMTLMAHFNLELHQMDMNITFLNGAGRKLCVRRPKEYSL